jgi:hypothetical protein
MCGSMKGSHLVLMDDLGLLVAGQQVEDLVLDHGRRLGDLGQTRLGVPAHDVYINIKYFVSYIFVYVTHIYTQQGSDSFLVCVRADTYSGVQIHFSLHITCMYTQ